MFWKMKWFNLRRDVDELRRDVDEIEEKMVDQKDLNPVKKRVDLLFRAACWVVGLIMMSVIGAVMALILRQQ